MTRLTLRHYILVALSVFILFLPGRASLPPLDRDEPRYMEATAQMLHSGNYVDVRFLDQPRYLQPAGIYWLEATAVRLTGMQDAHAVWPYRIPSLLAVTASAVLTAWIGAALFGPMCGLLGAALLAVSVLMTAEGRMATIDTTLLLFVLLAQCGLLRAYLDRERDLATPLAAALLYWTALGCGLMLKGPVILIPGFGTPLALALVERRIDWWKRLRPAWGWLVMLAIVLPWCVAIGVISHGDFFSRAVGRNFLGKVASGQETHGLPPGYHLAVFAIAFWPGSVFAAMSLPFVWERRFQPHVRYLLCWIVPHWLVFEAIATKLPHYVLPTYPAIAILTAAAIVSFPTDWEWPRAIWGRSLLAAYGLIWFTIGSVLAFAGPVLLWRMEGMVSPAPMLVPAGALPLLGLSGYMILHRDALRAAMAAVAAAIIIHVGLFTTVIPRLQTIWLSPRLAAMVDAHRPCARTIVASTSDSEPSLVFLLGQDTRLINATAAADFLQQNPKCGMALVGARDLGAFSARIMENGLDVHELGQQTGLNYSTGKHLEIGLYAVVPPAAR
ncbi:undecaprenyl phosphate-alpha-4-amino-4-deoxy-L-arabinose arabinosyl transferase [Komagataeibacter europaeus]|uniref:Undecaprenyl phosphate-alpha-4-amino-4-deoxy-L-arabinose arabinosyl transferase n=1 Tax=Komagataeibacter europaeus TaxID=33995 RepID=A0A0M0EK83_KOMEU|nr:glycosyltransferase family 39 protein [Komagataeibacter europaeus]KON65659.1 undecaprenyl phosphate-alpha-4-amino-4-deoxy-L-arabinose arabinosyl transferase [Komagataeibacter europaeus]